MGAKAEYKALNGVHREDVGTHVGRSRLGRYVTRRHSATKPLDMFSPLLEHCGGEVHALFNHFHYEQHMHNQFSCNH